MIIKLLPGDTGKSALVVFSKVEMLNFGISGSEFTLKKRKTRLLLERIFVLLRATTGLKRDGNFVVVSCRPLKRGGCRFLIEFTPLQSGRLFEFQTADDLLDALNMLDSDILSSLEITHSGGNYQIYIPSGAGLTAGELSALNEYAE